MNTRAFSSSEYFSSNSHSGGEKLVSKRKRAVKNGHSKESNSHGNDGSPAFDGEKSAKTVRRKRQSTETVKETVKRGSRNKRVESEVTSRTEIDPSVSDSLKPVCSSVQSRDESYSFTPKASVDENNTSSSDVEWEDVEDFHYSPLDGDSQSGKEKVAAAIPEKTVQITIEQQTSQKKTCNVKDAMRQLLNRYKKRLQENVHKTHLLCLLAHGQYKNRLCQDRLLLGLALSVVPCEFFATLPDTCTLTTLHSLVDWFHRSFAVDSQQLTSLDVYVDLRSRPSEFRVASLREHVLLFVLVCRALGLCTRLVYSLQPVSFKPSDLKLKTASKAAAAVDRDSAQTIASQNSKHRNKAVSRKRTTLPNPTCKSVVCISSGIMEVDRTSDEVVDMTSNLGKTQLKRHCRRPVNYDESVDSMDQSVDSMDQSSSSAESDDESSKLHNEQETVTVPGKRTIRRRSRKLDQKTSATTAVEGDSDDDFECETVYRTPVSTAPSRKLSLLHRRRHKMHNIAEDDKFILSSDPTEDDWWSEVYLESESRWISVSSGHGVFDDVERISSEATQPLCYVLSFDADNCVKDITAKYSANWATSLRRLRLDEQWWNEVLDPFKPSSSCVRNVAEDQLISEKMLREPFPSTIAEYKNHPLYVLQRHLLKFEAIYPPTAVPLGFVRKEPIYARECVQTLHAREKWYTEGRIVRIGEEPYKIVRARPKPNKPKEFNDALKLSLFGYWQTEEYVPPPAVNGKVPVNEYGNVEVFQLWMLPKGTVRIRDMPGLNKVARKLNVDCAAAMVGWEFHSGINHPVFDGWVVCEEHRESLVYAWEEEQAVLQQKEHDKKQQRIYDNWARLVRGVRIMQRLKKKFDVEEEPRAKKQKKPRCRSRVTSGRDEHQNVESDKADNVDGLADGQNGTKVTNTSLYWPQNRESSSAAETTESNSLFPFEKKSR